MASGEEIDLAGGTLVREGGTILAELHKAQSETLGQGGNQVLQIVVHREEGKSLPGIVVGDIQEAAADGTSEIVVASGIGEEVLEGRVLDETCSIVFTRLAKIPCRV